MISKERSKKLISELKILKAYIENTNLRNQILCVKTEMIPMLPNFGEQNETSI